MKTFVRGAFAAITLGTTAVSAFAADLPTRKEAPIVQDDFQRFQVRLLATGVVPLDGTATIYDRGNGSYMNNLTPLYGGVNGNTIGQVLNSSPATALQAIGYSNGAGSVFNGAGTTISWSVIPSLSLGYYLNKNWSIEAICCVTPHHVQGTGSIFGSSVIKTWVFPPSLTLVYHFTNFGGFQPYLGAGVNFTAFWGTRAGNQPFALSSPVGAAANNGGLPGFNGGYTALVTATAATITPSWGVVGQAGFDYMINQNWGWNFDAKYIMMEPNAHVWANASALPNQGSALFDTVYGARGGYPLSVPLNLAVKINPIVISTGLTYRFGGSKEPGIVNTATGGVLAKAGSLLPQF
jgi:outer membrane protein